MRTFDHNEFFRAVLTNPKIGIKNLTSNFITRFNAAFGPTSSYLDRNLDGVRPNIQSDAEKLTTRQYRKTQTGVIGLNERVRFRNDFNTPAKTVTERHLREQQVHKPRNEPNQNGYPEQWRRVKQSPSLKRSEIEEEVLKDIFDISMKRVSDSNMAPAEFVESITLPSDNVVNFHQFLMSTPAIKARVQFHEAKQVNIDKTALEKFIEFINQLDSNTQSLNNNYTPNRFIPLDAPITLSPAYKQAPGPQSMFLQPDNNIIRHNDQNVGVKSENVYMNNLYFRNYPNRSFTTSKTWQPQLSKTEQPLSDFLDSKFIQTENYEAKITKKFAQSSGSATRNRFIEPTRRNYVWTFPPRIISSNIEVTTEPFQHKLLRVEQSTRSALIDRNDPTLLNWMYSYLATVERNKGLGTTVPIRPMTTRLMVTRPVDISPTAIDFTMPPVFNGDIIDISGHNIQRLYNNPKYQPGVFLPKIKTVTGVSLTSRDGHEKRPYDELFSTTREFSIPENLHKIIENLMIRTNNLRNDPRTIHWPTTSAKTMTNNVRNDLRTINWPTTSAKRHNNERFNDWLDEVARRETPKRVLSYLSDNRIMFAMGDLGKNTMGSTYRKPEASTTAGPVETRPPSKPYTSLYLNKEIPAGLALTRLKTPYNFENPLGKYLLSPSKSPMQDALHYITHSAELEAATTPIVPIVTRGFVPVMKLDELFPSAKPVNYLPLVAAPPLEAEFKSWYDSFGKVTPYQPHPFTQNEPLFYRNNAAYLNIPNIVTREYVTKQVYPYVQTKEKISYEKVRAHQFLNPDWIDVTKEVYPTFPVTRAHSTYLDNQGEKPVTRVLYMYKKNYGKDIKKKSVPIYGPGGVPDNIVGMMNLSNPVKLEELYAKFSGDVAVLKGYEVSEPPYVEGSTDNKRKRIAAWGEEKDTLHTRSPTYYVHFGMQRPEKDHQYHYLWYERIPSSSQPGNELVVTRYPRYTHPEVAGGNDFHPITRDGRHEGDILAEIRLVKQQARKQMAKWKFL